MLEKEFNPPLYHPAYFIKKYLFKSINKFAPELKGKLLDFGCGVKPYQSLFSVDEYIGLDYYGEGETYEKSKVDVFYDGKTIPFEDNHFDSIFSTEVLEHVFNPDQIIPELNRVLKPGGKMLLTCPFAFPEHEIPTDYARYTSFGLKDLLKRNGFNIIQYEKTGNFIIAKAQLRSIYWNLHILSKINKIPVIRQVVRRAFFITTHSIAILKSKLLPKSDIFYLSNIILVEKRK